MALRLKRILESRGVPLKEYSALLGISEKTLYNKLSGATEFTIGEFQRFKTFLPEYDVLYLLWVWLTDLPQKRYNTGAWVALSSLG